MERLDLICVVHKTSNLWAVEILCLQLLERRVNWVPGSRVVEENRGRQSPDLACRFSLGRPLIGQSLPWWGHLRSAGGNISIGEPDPDGNMLSGKGCVLSLIVVLQYVSWVYTAAAETQLCIILSYWSYVHVYHFLTNNSWRKRPRGSGEEGKEMEGESKHQKGKPMTSLIMKLYLESFVTGVKVSWLCIFSSNTEVRVDVNQDCENKADEAQDFFTLISWSSASGPSPHRVLVFFCRCKLAIA